MPKYNFRVQIANKEICSFATDFNEKVFSGWDELTPEEQQKLLANLCQMWIVDNLRITWEQLSK